MCLLTLIKRSLDAYASQGLAMHVTHSHSFILCQSLVYFGRFGHIGHVGHVKHVETLWTPWILWTLWILIVNFGILQQPLLGEK